MTNAPLFGGALPTIKTGPAEHVLSTSSQCFCASPDIATPERIEEQASLPFDRASQADIEARNFQAALDLAKAGIPVFPVRVYFEEKSRASRAGRSCAPTRSSYVAGGVSIPRLYPVFRLVA